MKIKEIVRLPVVGCRSGQMLGICMIIWFVAASCAVPCFASFDHTLFSNVLKDHVANGVVNYKAIKNDERFTQYIDMLKKFDPSELKGNEKLAFWINVYNAYNIKMICDNYPVKSPMDLGSGGLVVGTIFKSTAWDKKNVTVGGKVMTLNQVENDIIRPMGDPRIHFAIVCAAKSCPPLRSEAYEASKLNEQLEDQGRKFMNQSKKNDINVEKRTAALSKIFDWFKADFQTNGNTVVKFVSKYLSKEKAEVLMANEKTYSYTEYDWSLNE
jgi:hypothetical protein